MNENVSPRIRKLTPGMALATTIATMLVALVGPAAAQRGHEVEVMTRNLYMGASLDGVMASTNPYALATEVAKVWAAVQATDFPDRAEALAGEIAEAKPLLIGLQEVALWRTQFPSHPSPATEVAYDFLQILLDELAERHAHYEVAAMIQEMDAELPSINGRDVRLTDRDVILVRRDKRRMHHDRVQVLDTRSGYYQTLLQVPVGGVAVVTVLRGWVAADVRVGKRFFRFVNTHLETDVIPPIQEAQAREFLAGPAAVSWPVIAVGDFNSNAPGPGTQSYQLLIAGGLRDAWTQGKSRGPGFTWGHDADLRNATPNLTQRLDLVLYRGPFEASRVYLVGDRERDKTGSGLWPSDHAGVVAKLHPHR